MTQKNIQIKTLCKQEEVISFMKTIVKQINKVGSVELAYQLAEYSPSVSINVKDIQKNWKTLVKKNPTIVETKDNKTYFFKDSFCYEQSKVVVDLLATLEKKSNIVLVDKED